MKHILWHTICEDQTRLKLANILLIVIRAIIVAFSVSIGCPSTHSRRFCNLRVTGLPEKFVGLGTLLASDVFMWLLVVKITLSTNISTAEILKRFM